MMNSLVNYQVNYGLYRYRTTCVSTDEQYGVNDIDPNLWNIWKCCYSVVQSVIAEASFFHFAFIQDHFVLHLRMTYDKQTIVSLIAWLKCSKGNAVYYKKFTC